MNLLQFLCIHGTFCNLVQFCNQCPGDQIFFYFKISTKNCNKFVRATLFAKNISQATHSSNQENWVNGQRTIMHVFKVFFFSCSFLLLICRVQHDEIHVYKQQTKKKTRNKNQRNKNSAPRLRIYI